MIDNTIIVEIDMPNEIDVDLGDAKFITAPERQVPQAVPQIDVDDNGLITATSVQEAGSVRAGTTKSIYQLAVEQGKTISPSGESQVAIEKGRFAVGDIVVSPLKVQEKELNVTDGGNYEVIPDNDYLLSKVGVNVDISAKVDEAFKAGKKAEYDAFWNSFQQNGTRTNYGNAFYGGSFNNTNFKPKYPIKPIKADYMFSMNGESNFGGLKDFDFVENGIELDLSGAKSCSMCFSDCWGVTRLGEINLSSCTNLNRQFFGFRGKTIDKLVIAKNSQYTATFDYAYNLENITIVGEIDGNGLNFSYSTKLSHESLMSIINCLKDLNGTSTTKTLILGTANLAKLTDAEKAIATEKGWTLA